MRKENLHILEWKTFYNFCKRNHWEKDKNQTGNLIKQLDAFVGEERVRI